jgi:hypothetical protein
MERAFEDRETGVLTSWLVLARPDLCAYGGYRPLQNAGCCATRLPIKMGRGIELSVSVRGVPERLVLRDQSRVVGHGWVDSGSAETVSANIF